MWAGVLVKKVLVDKSTCGTSDNQSVISITNAYSHHSHSGLNSPNIRLVQPAFYYFLLNRPVIIL